MWPDRVSNPGPLTYESGALPTALRGLASGLSKQCKPKSDYPKGSHSFIFRHIQVSFLSWLPGLSGKMDNRILNETAL